MATDCCDNAVECVLSVSDGSPCDTRLLHRLALQKKRMAEEMESAEKELYAALELIITHKERVRAQLDDVRVTLKQTESSML